MSTGRSAAGSIVLILLFSVGQVSAAPPTTAPAGVGDKSPATQPAGVENKTPATAPAPAPEKGPQAAKERNYYVAPKSLATRTETQPPGYVKTVDQYGLPKDMSWLEFGALQRTRFELRDDEYRQSLASDSRFLMRNQGYVGIRDVLDPIRLGFEFLDARVEGGDFPKNTRDIDEAEVLQAFVELYFKDVFGPGHPLRFQAGRMTLDYIDRRLVSRTRWGNTIVPFDGLRFQLGEQKNDWQVDAFAAMPVDRRLTRPDHGNDRRWLYGLVGDWRRWSQFITLEPYYFALGQTIPDTERELHTMGLRGYGLIGKTGLDYDVDTSFQWGDSLGLAQRAFAFQDEIGYTFKHSWKPRLAALTIYASGDRSPNDKVSNRFDRLYGNGNALNIIDLFELSNTISEALRCSLDPTDKLHTEFIYRSHWLASARDSWTTTGRRDATGGSGHFVGQTLEVSMRYQVLRQLDLDIGYAHFIPGTFAKGTGPAPDSDFFYVQTTLKLDRP